MLFSDSQVEGVLAVHEFHVWQLAGSRIIASAHITCKNLHDYFTISETVKEIFHNEGIHSTSIQPEFVQVISLRFCFVNFFLSFIFNRLLCTFRLLFCVCFIYTNILWYKYTVSKFSVKREEVENSFEEASEDSFFIVCRLWNLKRLILIIKTVKNYLLPSLLKPSILSWESYLNSSIFKSGI